MRTGCYQSYRLPSTTNRKLVALANKMKFLCTRPCSWLTCPNGTRGGALYKRTSINDVQRFWWFSTYLPKCQLISKCPFGVTLLTKIATKILSGISALYYIRLYNRAEILTIITMLFWSKWCLHKIILVFTDLYNVWRFLPYIVRSFGVILDLPTLKLDVINGRSPKKSSPDCL